MNTHIKYHPSQTIYTHTKDEQGDFTAHIITNTTNTKPSLMCYFESFDAMHNAVVKSYGEARHVEIAGFQDQCRQQGLSWDATDFAASWACPYISKDNFKTDQYIIANNA